MQEPYWWYVLFVRAGKENSVVEELGRFLIGNSKGYLFDVFYLESEQYFRNKKYQIVGHEYKKRPLFPGYVFVETNMPQKLFIGNYIEYIKNSLNIIKLLSNGQAREGELPSIAVADFERERLEYLFRGKHCLEHSVGYMVGDKITIKSGPLVGREGEIKYVNRHNRSAIIEFEMFGTKVEVKVGLEVIYKNG